MTRASPIDLLMTHAQVQLGTYFSRLDDLGSGLYYVSSDRIVDSYWNYGFGLQASLVDLPKHLNKIHKHAQSLNREPVLYIHPGTTPTNIDELVPNDLITSEAWMILTAPDVPAPTINEHLEIRVVENLDERDAFIKVFENAYGQGEVGSPGYSGLPQSYPDSIRAASPQRGVTVVHFLGFVNAEPVAIASIFIKPPFAGLYNVGTVHRWRRKGFGWALSCDAVRHALTIGCKTIFLQTEPDSAVEELYGKMGFSRIFAGRTIRLT